MDTIRFVWKERRCSVLSRMRFREGCPGQPRCTQRLPLGAHFNGGRRPRPCCLGSRLGLGLAAALSGAAEVTSSNGARPQRRRRPGRWRGRGRCAPGAPAGLAGPLPRAPLPAAAARLPREPWIGWGLAGTGVWCGAGGARPVTGGGVRARPGWKLEESLWVLAFPFAAASGPSAGEGSEAAGGAGAAPCEGTSYGRPGGSLASRRRLTREEDRHCGGCEQREFLTGRRWTHHRRSQELALCVEVFVLQYSRHSVPAC